MQGRRAAVLEWAQAMSAYSGTMEESQLLSSVYFDSWNLSHQQVRTDRTAASQSRKFKEAKLIASRRKGPDATSYQERIRREEGARLVRLGMAVLKQKSQNAQNLKPRTLLGVGTCWGSIEYR